MVSMHFGYKVCIHESPSPQIFWWVRVAHLFSFLWCVFVVHNVATFFWTVPSVVANVYSLPTVSLVSYVPNVASFFWTVPSVIVTVYLLFTVLHVSYVPNFASFAGYFILDCPFGYL